MRSNHPRRGRFGSDLRTIVSAIVPPRAALVTLTMLVCVLSLAGALTIFADDWRGKAAETSADAPALGGPSDIPPPFTGAPVTEGTRSIVLKVDGVERRLTTAQTTVFDVLAEAGVTLCEQDEVFPNGNSGLLENMAITVVRVTEETQKMTVDVPFDTIFTKTPTLFVGEEKEVQAGKPGLREITMRQTLRDGFLSEQRVLEATTLSDPRAQIIWIGTKKRPAATTKPPKTTAKPPATTKPPPVQSITTAGGTTYTYTQKLAGDSVAYYSKDSNPLTYTGNKALPGKTIAVDPKFIPLGSLVYITSVDGKSWSYGPAYAHDIGGGIKGNIIDLFKGSYEEAVAHGRRDCIIYILKP